MPYPEHLDEGIIHTWLDGQLPAAEGEALEAHLRECPDCAARVAEERGFLAGASGILTALDSGFSTGAPDSRPEKVGGVVPITAAAPAPVRRRPRRWVMPGAAAATLVVAVGTTLVMRGGGGDAVRESASSVVMDSAAPSAGLATTSAAIRVASPPPRAAAPSGVLPPVVPSTPAERSMRRDLANAQAVAAEQTVAANEAREEVPRPLAAPAPSAPPPSADFSGRGVAGGVARGVVGGVVAQKSAEPQRPDLMRAERTTEARPAAPTAPAVQDARLTISGRVTDQNDAPVAGAAVGLRGTTVAASTDANGRYALAVPAGVADSAAVVARRIGFAPESRSVALPSQGTVTVDLALRVQATQLEAVVATGAGAAAGRSAAETGPYLGCWTLSRPPAGIPARVRLDSTSSGSRSLRGGQRLYRLLSGQTAVGAPVGWWRPADPPGPTTRVVVFPAATGGDEDRSSNGGLAGDTVAARRVGCPSP